MYAAFLTLSVASMLLASPALAESPKEQFLVPMETLSRKASYIVKPDGTVVEGKIKSAAMMNGGINAFRFEGPDGEAVKFKAEEVVEVGNEPSDLARFAAIVDRASDLSTASNTDYDEIANREWIVFQQVEMPGKKERYKLLQLLNPGTNKGLSVYLDPAMKMEASVGVGPMNFTLENQTFLVVKDGESVRVKGKKYKKEFPELFSDCKPVLEHPSAYNKRGKLKPNAEDFPLHVRIYAEECAGE